MKTLITIGNFWFLAILLLSLISNAVANENLAVEEDLFDVWEYRIEGNSLLDSQEIEKAVYGFLGPKKTFTNVEQARTALEERYRSKGYGTVLVDIPEQSVGSGIIRLKVNEAVVDRVKVTGSRYFSNRRIKEQIPSLQQGQVPNINEVQKDLALLNSRSPDRTITPLLRPGKTPGSVEMELKVKDELPTRHSIELNDQATSNTTDYRLNASVSFNNLWQREHGLTLSYQTAPKDRSEVDVLSLNYLYKPERSRNVFLFYAVNSNSDVSTVGDLTVIGNGKIFGTRAIIPLQPAGDLYHNLIAGFDYKDFDDDIQLGGIVTDELATAIDYGSFAFSYSGSIVGDEYPTQFTIGSKMSVRGFYSTDSEFENKRTGADPNFLVLTGSVNKTFHLFSEYALSTRLDGQFTNEPLISNEQFSMGGENNVRGYLQSDVLVDQGLIASAEFQSPHLFQDRYEWINFLQWFSFIDWSAGEIREALPDQDDNFDLLGVGLGVRFTLWDDIEGSIAWARPLEETNSTEKNDDRMHFSVKYRH